MPIDDDDSKDATQARQPLLAMTREELIAEIERLRSTEVSAAQAEKDNERLREAQMELAELGARYMDLYETAPVPCCILDPKGVVRELNREGAKLLGGEMASLRGRSLAQFVTAKERRLVLEHISDVVGDGRPRALTVTMLASGGWPPIVIKMVSHSLGKEGAGCRTALFDVTEDKRAEESLRLAVRMREDFLAVVAHDLRGPLAVVAMSAELLERQQIPEQQREIARIRRSTKRMNRLIADLLDVSSMDAGHLALEPAPEDIEALIVTALEIASPLAAAKHISLSSHVDRGSLQAWCDRERVIQVLLNLLGNAIKFTSSGAVSVRAQRCGADEVVLSVHDTGKGMSRTQIERAFDPYWQAAPQSRQGTGLGLSIVKGIVELHGGRVWAESNQGRGSSFSFTLPTRQPGVVDPLAETTTPLQVPSVASLTNNGISGISSVTDVPMAADAPAGPLVLLIDDEGAVRESIAEALRTEGYDVVALPHGRAALDYLESAQVLPTVILLDLVMPVMDGWEFLRQQSRAPRIAEVPVVLVSAQADRAGAEQLQRLAGYIQKPVRLANLCEVVGNCTNASL